MEKAFSIVGRLNNGAGTTPVFGVLFVPETTGSALLKNNQPHMGVFKSMGFDKVGLVVELSTPAPTHKPHPEPTFYYFECSPQPMRVVVAKVTPDGRMNRNGSDVKHGEPHTIIPHVRSMLAERHMKAGDFVAAEFPKPAIAASNNQQRRAMAVAR